MGGGGPPPPPRPDEVVVTRQFVKAQHRGVGDSLTIRLATTQEATNGQAGDEAPKLHGPVIRARIVGVVTSPWFGDANNGGDQGGLTVSPGLTATYPGSVYGDRSNPENSGFENALVRLHGGATGISAFQRSLQKLTGRTDIDIWNRPQQTAEAQRHYQFLSQCLAAFAAAVLAAALVLIGQAIARFTSGSASELQTMQAVGMTPSQAIAAAAAAPVFAGVLGSVLGAAGAFAASPLFPYGSTRFVEPHLGLSFDPVVLIGVPVAVVLVVLAGAFFSAWTGLSAARRPGQGDRRSAVATAVRRSGAPVPVLIGTRFALEPGRGRNAVPVRPALIGAVAGVLGIVGAFTVAHGVRDASENPKRFGQTTQLSAFLGLSGKEFGPSVPITAAVAQQNEVTGVDNSRIAVATAPNDVTTTLFEYQSGPKPIPLVLTGGRRPVAADEVVLASRAMSLLHTHIGQRVQLAGTTPGRLMLVTGQGFVPEGPHNSYADGGWVTTAGFDAMFAKSFKYRIILVTLRPGLNPAATAKTLAAQVNQAIPQLQGGAAFEAVAPPTELLEVREVQRLPIALGIFLVLLALAAVGHALATAVRRRSGDIAVLRALGLTRRQSRWIVVTQATLLALVGLIFGIPLGLALGRFLWRVIADFTPVQYVAPLAISVLLLVVPLAILAANVLAAWPGRQVGRLRVAHVLRAE